MLYTLQHKVVVIKTARQKTFDWPIRPILCRVSIASASRKIGNPWFPNGIYGIYGENRAMETDAQLAALQIVRSPWAVRPTGHMGQSNDRQNVCGIMYLSRRSQQKWDRRKLLSQ
jgi:hypothetical protein